MLNYEVTWSIDIDALSFEDAAKEADTILKDRTAPPLIFEIRNKTTGVKKEIGMDEFGSIEL